MLDRWYRFEEGATAEALRGWCEVHGIEVIDDRGDPSGAEGLTPPARVA